IDWGYAREYMELAHRILQHDKADDFVVATGEAHSVEEFVREAFACVGLDPERFVRSDSAHSRPTKTSTLVGDTTKLRTELGVEPKVRFKELVRLMVEADLAEERARRSAQSA